MERGQPMRSKRLRNDVMGRRCQVRPEKDETS
jgi:hypothetical protein